MSGPGYDGMNKTARQDVILDRVMREGGVSVDALAGDLGVSVMTIRRDLSELAYAGRLSRRHGGAIPARGGIAEFAFRERSERHAAGKHAIAQAVAAMVQPGMAIGLDTGTTTLEVARALTTKTGITVLTTSLAVASVLHVVEGIEVMLLGGNVRKNSPDLTGPLAERNIRQFRMHLVVLGADAVKQDGVYTTDVRIAGMTRAFTENANRVVLVVDSSKFGATAFVQCLELGEVHCVVTDDGCPESVRSWLGRRVGEVIYAPVSGVAGVRT